MDSRRLIPAGSTVTWLAVIVVIGGLVRIGPVAGSGFPLGDGGLFASMIGDIRDAAFALPSFTTYNGGDIPFAYPPLALYVGAFLPIDPLTTLQWLPSITAAACIIPVYLIGSRMGSSSIGLGAAAFYALAPFGWFWLIQGGGLTRSLALLLALSTIAAALRGRAVAIGVLGGLTALTHPEAAIVAAVAVAAILAVERSWRTLVISAAISAVVVAPWIAVVVAQHGWDPLLAAGGARSVNPLVAMLSISGGRPGALDLAAAIGLIALAACGVRWLYAAAIATAVLVSTSVETHFAPLMAAGFGIVAGARDVPRPALAATGLLLLLGAGVSIGNPEPLGADDRALMSWIGGETPDAARFAVISDEVWSRADEAEWFPHLTGRVSVVTMQGREWLPNWQELNDERLELAGCQSLGCIQTWMDGHDAEFLYLADDCCARLASLMTDGLVRQEGTAGLYRLPGRGG